MLLDETDYLVYDYGSMSALPPSDSEESNADSGADDGSGTIHGANPYGSGHKMITDYYILGDSNTAKNLKLLQVGQVGAVWGGVWWGSGGGWLVGEPVSRSSTVSKIFLVFVCFLFFF